MNKLLLSTLLCLGLAACTTPGQQGTATEQPQASNVSEKGKDNETTSATSGNSDKAKVTQPESKPKPVKPKPLPVKTSDGKLILGKEEWVYVPGMEQSFKAKVDADAATSSVSAVEVVPFEREGKQWVKFKIKHNGVLSQQISSPVVRWIKISKSQKHPVVTAWIEVGEIKEKTDFILIDESGLDYPIVLGQSFFRDIAIVDMSRNRVQPKKK